MPNCVIERPSLVALPVAGTHNPSGVGPTPRGDRLDASVEGLDTPSVAGV